MGAESQADLDALYAKLTAHELPAEQAVKQLMEMVGSTIVQQAGLSVMNAQKGVLPHGWLEDDGERRSTLDLVGYDGLTLISFGEHERWAEAIAHADRPGLAQIRIGRDASPEDGAWASACGMDEGGALLVRPDQHVAWRAALRSRAPFASPAMREPTNGAITRRSTTARPTRSAALRMRWSFTVPPWSLKSRKASMDR